MKLLSVIIGMLWLALTARAALPQPDLIAQIHFAGAEKISSAPNSSAFTNEFCSAEALALRAQTAGKLSVWLAGWLQTNLNTAVADGPAKLRSLFDDLQTSEWLLEARVAAAGKPETAIAIRLDATRAQFWQASLKPFFPAAVFKSTGGWLIFDSDPALLKLGDRLAKKISAPSTNWLDVDVNWPVIAGWHPLLKELALPETQINVMAPDNNFKVTGKFFFPENLTLNLEPWRIPTNTVRQPFNSFTAVRGFASWFQSQGWAQPYHITPAPNQLFLWSLPSSPFQTYAAIPVTDAASMLNRLYTELAPAVSAANASRRFIIPIRPELTNSEIAIKGIPFVALALRALTEPEGQFLVGEMFPSLARGTALPPELFTQLATKNLVFYHWEITAQRMPQLLHVSQFDLMFTRHKQLDAGSAAMKWLQRIGPTLGHTSTEITQTGPAEFTLARKVPGLFTGTELYALANWLEATNFPGCNLDLSRPPQPAGRSNPQQFQFTTPVPAAPH